MEIRLRSGAYSAVLFTTLFSLRLLLLLVLLTLLDVSFLHKSNWAVAELGIVFLLAIYELEILKE